MLTRLDANPDTFNKHERQIVADIKEFGWFHTSVYGEAKFEQFSYTTGFWVSSQTPEILTFGLGKAAHSIFWHMFRQGKAGVKYPLSMRANDILADFPAILFPVAKKYYSEFPLSSRWFYRGEDFPCLQLVWPDLQGRFPWEQGFDESFLADQPDLTEHGWLHSLAN
jgi:hypothetical protein